MTKRSKYATLKVKLNSEGCIHSRLSALREFLIHHLSFIQSIELYRPPPSNEFLQELPAHSARCLEHLHLRHDPRSSNTMVLIKRLLDDPRCLKTSNTRCAVVDWGSKIFTTLIHLVLYFDGRTVTEPIPNFSMHSRGCPPSECFLFITSLHPREICPPQRRMFVCHSCKLYYFISSALAIFNVPRHIPFPEGT